MIWKQAAAFVLLSVLAVASAAEAAVNEVTVRIDGLACPFCTYNIEKRVKTLDGVERNARIVTRALRQQRYRSFRALAVRFAWPRTLECSRL